MEIDLPRKIHRFNANLHVSRHASVRMRERQVSHSELSTLLESGDVRLKDQTRGWIAMHFEGRSDNLICAAIVHEGNWLIVKTVMHRFVWEG